MLLLVVSRLHEGKSVAHYANMMAVDGFVLGLLRVSGVSQFSLFP